MSSRLILALAGWLSAQVLSGAGRYLDKDVSAVTPLAKAMGDWFGVCIFNQLLTSMFVMGYGSDKQMGKWCIAQAATQLATAIFVHLSAGALFTDAANGEGNVLRAILITANVAGAFFKLN